MPHDGVQTGVAEQDFQRGTRGWVAFPVGLDRLTQEHESHATIPLWKLTPYYPIVGLPWAPKPNPRAGRSGAELMGWRKKIPAAALQLREARYSDARGQEFTRN